MREQQLKEKRSVRYEGIWRDRDPAEAPQGRRADDRLKAPQAGDTVIRDHVQGESRSAKRPRLDDLIILRADGTPTTTSRSSSTITTWASPTSSAATTT